MGHALGACSSAFPARGWGLGAAGVLSTHLLVGRVHALRQVLGSLVHQLFPGQAPAAQGSGAALVAAAAGAADGAPAAGAHTGAQLQLAPAAVLAELEGLQGQRACPVIAWPSGQPEVDDLLPGEGPQAQEARG